MIDLTFEFEDKGARCVLHPLSIGHRADWGDAFLNMPYSPHGASLGMADNALSSIVRGQKKLSWDGERLTPHNDWRLGYAFERTGVVVGFACFAGHPDHESGITQTILMMVPAFTGLGYARPLWNIAPVLFGDRLGYDTSTIQLTEHSILRAATTELPAIDETANPSQQRRGRSNPEVLFENYTLAIDEFIQGVRQGLAPRAAGWFGKFSDPDVEGLFPHHILPGLEPYL